MGQKTPAIRLVTFLGMGPEKSYPPHYQPVRYRYKTSLSQETPLLEVALAELFAGIRSVVIIGTPDVRKRWFDSGLYKKLEGPGPFEFVELDLPETEQQRWELFDKVKSALLDERRENETEPPEHILIDVTHGFRAQAILGMAALSFALSERARLNLGNQPSMQIVYGAYESRDEETKIAPIWDLTELVTASRWNAALDAFMRYGRADDLEHLASEDARSRVTAAIASGKQGKALKAEAFARVLGDAVRRFADDLALARAPLILKSSGPNLLRVLCRAETDELVASIPPLRSAVTALRDWVAPICSDKAMSEDGVRSQIALARLYQKLQRYSEQASLLREVLVTLYGHFAGFAMGELVNKQADDTRKEIENKWKEAVRKKWHEQDYQRLHKDQGSKLADLLKLSNEIQEPRNQIAHSGMQSEISSASKLREDLASYLSRLEKLVDPHERRSPQEHKPMFLNLSNHPIASWTEAQRSAAAELGLGDLQDLDGGMPVIDPSSEASDIEKLAEHIADRALAQGATSAHVATELSLTFALVLALQRRGIACYVATTGRAVTQKELEGGVIAKTSQFDFVRWRRYL